MPRFRAFARKYRRTKPGRQARVARHFVQASRVTTWDGTLLDPVVRSKLRRGDFVRVLTPNIAIYCTIFAFRGSCCVGMMTDPYRYHRRCPCQLCGAPIIPYTTLEFYTCEGFCDYYLCASCMSKGAVDPAGHKLFLPDIVNGTILKFPRWAISEVPGHTDNTTRLGERHLCQRRVLITGVAGSGECPVHKV